MNRPPFSPRQSRILEALAEALLPADVGIPIGTAELGVPARTAKMLGGPGSEASRAVGLLLVAFDLLVPLVLATPRRFVSLTPAERLRYLERWDRSPLYGCRGVVMLLKALVGMVYCSAPEVQRAIGYVPGNIVDGEVTDEQLRARIAAASQGAEVTS